MALKSTFSLIHGPPGMTSEHITQFCYQLYIQYCKTCLERPITGVSNIQYKYIVGKYKLYLYKLQKQVKMLAFFQTVSLRVQLILYLAIMYVNCVYPAISKSPKQLPNCLKIAETRVVLTVFIGVICSVSTYIVTVSLCCST